MRQFVASILILILTTQTVWATGFDSVTVKNGVTAGSVSATGGVSGATVTATGAVSGASVSATGAVSGASVSATGALSGGSAVVTGAAALGGALTMSQIATPANPASGKNAIYPKSDGKFYTLDSNGVETAVGTGSGGGWFTDYATNGTAESDTTGWTASGTSAPAVVRDTTNKYQGAAGFSWTPANADNYLTNTAYTITANQGISGQNCAALVYTKTAGTLHRLEAFDGSNVLAYKDIPATTNYQALSLNFPCPASGSVSIRVNAGDTTALYFDELHWGDARGVNVGWVSNITEWQAFTPTLSADWGTATNKNFRWRRVGGVIQVSGGITAGTVGGATGLDISLPSGLAYPAFTDGALISSYYRKIVGRWDRSTSSANARKGGDVYIISNGSTGGTNLSLSSEEYVTAVDPVSGPVGSSLINTGDALTINVWGVDIQGWSSEQAYKPDQVAQSWSGLHGSDCAWSQATSSTPADIAADDASCTFTARSNSNFGTVTSYGANKPGVVFTPNVSGKYLITALVQGYFVSASNQSFFQLTDGSNNILGTGVITATGSTRSGTTIVGMISATAGAATTVKIRLVTTSSTNEVFNIASIVPGAVTVAPVIEWNIVKISDSLPAPLLTGSVTSMDSGQFHTEFIKGQNVTCSTGTCSYDSKSAGITSVVYSSTGVYTLNFAAGAFSGPPACTFSSQTRSAGTYCNVNGNCTATSCPISCYAPNPSASGAMLFNDNPTAICMGPR